MKSFFLSFHVLKKWCFPLICLPVTVRERKFGNLLKRAKALVSSHRPMPMVTPHVSWERLQQGTRSQRPPWSTLLKWKNISSLETKKRTTPTTHRHARKKSLKNELIDPLFELWALVYYYTAGVNIYRYNSCLKCVVLLPKSLGRLRFLKCTRCAIRMHNI